MLYDDDPRRLPHRPIRSEDRKVQPDATVGRFCGNRAFCISCHPKGCPGNCNEFTPADVAGGHVGGTCDGCGASLPGWSREELRGEV